MSPYETICKLMYRDDLTQKRLCRDVVIYNYNFIYKSLLLRAIIVFSVQIFTVMCYLCIAVRLRDVILLSVYNLYTAVILRGVILLSVYNLYTAVILRGFILLSVYNLYTAVILRGVIY